MILRTRFGQAPRSLYLRALGQRRYQKFVVVGRGRTGSNLLMSLLGSHPTIEVCGEVFLRLDGECTRAIWDRVFEPRRRHVTHLGFRLFHPHPEDSDDRGVWQLLRDDTEIHVIRLGRRNFLRSRVSSQIASTTGQWLRVGDGGDPFRDRKRVRIDLPSCVAAFE